MNQSKPNGGFLPIYVCDKPDNQENKDNTKREYKAPVLSISIKTLMEKRREKNPLLPK